MITVDYHPTGPTVSGFVTDGRNEWLETTKFIGYYCDEEECPDDSDVECDLHPDGYWENAMIEQWRAGVRIRELTIVEDIA